ncbi:MAG: zinc-dependent alcohol dehydrogenase [Phycisphaerales bacterium]
MTTQYDKSYAIVFDRPRQAAYKQIPLAAVDDDTTVVQTTMSAISSGTDMKTWLGLQHPSKVWFPLVPGYEAVGRVVHVGRNVTHMKVGDRVMANECRYYPQQCAAWGGNAGYIIKNAQTGNQQGMDAVAKIPDNVSDEEAVCAYLACVAKRGVDKVAIRPGETVLVTGMGNIGLSACQLLKLRGAGRVIALDVQPARLKLAGKYADHVVDNVAGKGPQVVRELTGGKGVDVIFECSGNPRVVTDLPDYLRDGGWDAGTEGGRIHLQGDYPDPLILDQYHRWFTKNCAVTMCCAFRPGDKNEVLQLISAGKFDAKSLYSKVAPVEQCGQAYEELYANRYDLLKILFRWPG